MAKGDVKMVFDAETAEFVANVAKVRDLMKDAASTARSLGDATAKAGGQMSESLAGAAIGVAGSMGAITTATGILTAGLKMAIDASETLEKRELERANKALARSQSLGSSLAATGQSGSLAATERQISSMAEKNVGGRKFTEDELTRVFAAVSLGSKGLSAAEKVGAVGTYQEASAAGLNEAGATNVATIAAKLRQFNPNASQDQLSTDAYQLSTVYQGGLSDRDARIYARAKDKEQAKKLLIAAAVSDESSRSLSSVQSAADEDLSPQKLSEAKGEEGQRLRRLNAIPAENRLDAILGDATLAPQASRAGIRSLQRNAGRQTPIGTLADSAKSFDSSPSAVARRDVEDASKSLDDLYAGSAIDVEALAYQKRKRELFRKEHPFLSGSQTIEDFAVDDLQAIKWYAKPGWKPGYAPSDPKLEEIAGHLAHIRAENTSLKNNQAGQQ